MTREPDYEVGYGRPPLHTRFQPGQSGNLKGRPKGARGVSQAIAAALNEHVVVTENGRRRSVTKLDVIAKQIANQSAGGDLKAIKVVLDVMQRLEAIEEARAAGQGVSAADLKAMDAEVLKWMRENAAALGVAGDPANG